jgi:hypothetical protein
MIWTHYEAERWANICTNEYGEIDTSEIRRLSDGSWWSGVRYGVMAAFMPGFFLLLAVRYFA